MSSALRKLELFWDKSPNSGFTDIQKRKYIHVHPCLGLLDNTIYFAVHFVLSCWCYRHFKPKIILYFWHEDCMAMQLSCHCPYSLWMVPFHFCTSFGGNSLAHSSAKLVLSLSIVFFNIIVLWLLGTHLRVKWIEGVSIKAKIPKSLDFSTCLFHKIMLPHILLDWSFLLGTVYTGCSSGESAWLHKANCDGPWKYTITNNEGLGNTVPKDMN